MPRVREALQRAARDLAALADASARLEAELLLALVLDKDRSWLYAWPEQVLAPSQSDAFFALVARRAGGEPLAHITGRRSFWDFELEVGAATLIPRSETELLVERALALGGARAGISIADLGTGSGAVAAALARERPDWRLVATDRSTAALAIARRNFQRLAPAVETRRGDWYQALHSDERFDLIVSNPPYVAAHDPHLRRGDLPREPREALVAGIDGLAAIRQLTSQAPAHLRSGGWLVLEHGAGQGQAVRDILHELGLIETRTHGDLAGRERVTEARCRHQ